MSVSWRTTEFGILEVVERQGLSAKILGGFMLFFAGCFLYWLGTALVEYFRFGTWRDVLVALPGMAVALLMAALFGVPGVLMAFLKKRTLFNKADGLVRQVKSFGVFRRVREFRLSDVQLVASTLKAMSLKTRSGNIKRSGAGTKGYTIDLVLADKQQVEVALFGNRGSELELGQQLGQQLAGYLGVEFHDATG